MWTTFDPQALLETVAAHPELRWVQLPMAGIDRVLEAGVFDRPHPSGLVWTWAKGSYARPVAEHALCLALAGLRKLPERARARSWGERAGTTLFDAPVTVLGGGGITQELLALLAPFNVQATVVRRTASPRGRCRTHGHDGGASLRPARRPGRVRGPRPHAPRRSISSPTKSSASWAHDAGWSMWPVVATSIPTPW